MAGIKALAKQTAIYGLSSIIGRFLNWCLVPLYVYIFPTEEYGIVSYLYSFTAVALVILNYGMETGFFRFANKEGADSQKVYTTSLISVGTTSLLFIILLTLLITPISKALLLPQHKGYVWMLGFVVAIDAFTNIPFAWLRYANKAFTFAAIKLVNVFVNIGLNLFFIIACPKLEQTAPGMINWFYEPLGGQGFGIGWIFVANVISTLIVFLLLTPYFCRTAIKFSYPLLKSMLSYSWPLLILGVAGILSQNMGQIMIPYLFKGEEEAARSMVGIYGANIKVAIIMVMFTQAFRYAYEPFIFSRARSKGEEKISAYCDSMKYFILFGLFIFLGVMFYLPVLQYFISSSYRVGLQVVPVMMLAELFFGVFFNLSLWYKLTDRTRWGMYLSLLCFVLMFTLNILLVPAIGIPNGYMGSAWAALISYFIVMVVSYLLGRKYYPIPYDLKEILLFTVFAAFCYGLGMLVNTGSLVLTLLIRTVILVGYLATLFYQAHLNRINAKKQ